MVKMLLEHGATVDAVEMERTPDLPPKYASAIDTDDLLQPPHVGHGRTALHLACEHGREEVVELLLQHGANPAREVVLLTETDETTKKYFGHQRCQLASPLEVACCRGHTRIVKRLLRHPAAYKRRMLIDALAVTISVSSGKVGIDWLSDL